MISHIDLCIGLVAVFTLVRAARQPHPVHPTTAILLTLLTGVLLSAIFGLPDGRKCGTGASLRGWTQSQRPCSIAVGLSPPLWSASFTACRFHSSGVEGCVLVLDGVTFWSPSTPRRPLASDFYGGVVTLTSEVWTSGYSRLRSFGAEDACARDGLGSPLVFVRLIPERWGPPGLNPTFCSNDIGPPRVR